MNTIINIAIISLAIVGFFTILAIIGVAIEDLTKAPAISSEPKKIKNDSKKLEDIILETGTKIMVVDMGNVNKEMVGEIKEVMTFPYDKLPARYKCRIDGRAALYVYKKEQIAPYKIQTNEDESIFYEKDYSETRS